MTDLLTTAEAAEVLGVSVCTLRRRVSRNEVPHRRVFGMIRFAPEDIEVILREAYRPAVDLEEKTSTRLNGYVCKWVRT